MKDQGIAKTPGRGPMACLLVGLLACLATWVQGCEKSEAAAPGAASVPAPQGSSFDSPPARVEPPSGPVASKAIEPAPPADVKAATAPVPPPDPAPDSTVPVKAPSAESQPIVLSFATLASYRYALPPRQIPGENASGPLKGQIPDHIRALNGKKITIEGYMIPMDFEKGRIQKFVLSRSMIGCCFADSLRINELIKVAPADGKAVDYCDVARVTGTLEVGEEYEDGYLVCLYRMKADQIKDVPLK
jgi:hypothetical protein